MGVQRDDGIARARSSHQQATARPSAADTDLVVVLFTDIVGSTAWRAEVGDASADRLREPFDDLLTAAVVEHHGTVVKGLGDGIMAVFHSATTAVEGAIAIQRAVELEHRSTTSARLHVRVGLSVGDVQARGNDVHGLPVVEAARLCAAADGGRILCHAMVQGLAGSRIDTRFLTVGDLELKGLPAAIPVCEILWEPAGAPTPMPLALVRDEQFSFVGREVERDRLLATWEAAEGGACRCVLVSGEPGVGKTRLVAEVAERLHQQGAMVLFGRCEEGLGVPYQPFAEALRHYVDHVDRPAIGRFGGDLHRLVPELPRQVAGLDPPLQSDPDTERQRLHEAVALWLADASALDPVVLVLDDLHWATKPTLELLRHVLSSGHALRMLVVATYRDSDVGRSDPMADVLGDLLRTPGSASIVLGGLGPDGVQRFVAEAAGQDLGADGLQLADAIHDATGGNAFFVSEVLRNLVETGAVGEEAGRWTGTGSVDALRIPVGVREVVRRRLSRLDRTTNDALAVGATIGAEFEPGILAAAGRFAADSVEPALRAATDARLIEEVAGPRLAYRFAHALVRSTVYEDLSGLRRATLHRQVAEAIEAGGREGPSRSVDLAFHYGAAAVDGDVAKAVDWCTRAGRDAADRLAFSEALTHLERARALRAHGSPGDDSEQCDLLIEIGRAQWSVGDDRSHATLLEAAALADRLGDPKREARALLVVQRAMPPAIGGADPDRIAAIRRALASMDDGDSIERARLQSELALTLVYVTDTYPSRVALADEAVAMARRLDSPVTLAEVVQNHAQAIWAPGTVELRHRDIEELEVLGRDIRDPVWHALAQPRRITRAIESVDIDEAWRVSEAFDDMAEDLGLPLVRWMAGFHRASLLELRGDLEGATAAADEAAVHGIAAGQPDALLFQSVITGLVQMWRDEYERLVDDLEGIYQVFPDVPGLPPFLGLMLQRAGRPEDAMAVVGDLLATPTDLIVDGSLLTAWTVLGDFATLAGSVDHAPGLLDLLRPHAATVVGNGVNWNQAAAKSVGQLESLMGHWERAEAAFDVAEDIAGRLRAPLWQTMAQVDRAWMHARRGGPGDRDRALALLDVAGERGEAHGAHLVRHRSSIVVAELG